MFGSTILCSVTVYLTSGLLHSDHAPNVSRFKRQSGLTVVDTQDNCTVTCLQPMFVLDAAYFTSAGMLNFSYVISQQGNLTSLCGIAIPVYTCLQQCTASAWKEVVPVQLAYMNDTLCSGSMNTDVQNTGKCISQVQSFVQFRCNAICKLESVTGANWLYGSYHSLGDISVPAYTPAQLYAAVQKLLCIYVACMSNCAKPILDVECGVKAFNVTRSVIGNVYATLSADGIGFFNWAPICRDLIAN